MWKCQLVDGQSAIMIALIKKHFPGTSTIEQIIKEDSSELANEVRDFREKEREKTLLLI